MTTYLVRKSGNDNNGGTSASVRSTDTDGVTNGTNTLTSVAAKFVAGDVGHGIFIGGVNQWRTITAFNSSTSINFSGATIAAGSGRTWTIGGAWLTIGKVLGSAGFASGDTCYIGAGTYRETITVAMTSAVAETKLIGDVDGAQTGDAGYIVWTSYTTDDKTAPAAADTCNLAGRDYLTFQKIIFVHSSAANQAIDGTTATSTNITIKDCVFLPAQNSGLTASIQHTAAFGAASVWVIERCIFQGSCPGISITLPTGSGSDYDANIQIRNCRFQGQNTNCLTFTSSGSSAQEGGGIDIQNCTILYGTVATNSARMSLTIPCTINNCYILCPSGTALNSSESGNLTEDYNLIIASTARTNVTAGTHSITTAYAPMFHVGQAELCGFAPRPYLSPMTYDAPMMAFGDDGTALTTDILGCIKPGGGRSATRSVGCFEFCNPFVKSTANPRTGSNHLRCTGPGNHDFSIPVDATSTTVTIYTYWDGTYTGTKPAMKVINGGECGVADATATASGAASNWEQLSLNFTPTSKGIVTIRLVASDTNGGGNSDWDDFAVT